MDGRSKLAPWVEGALVRFSLSIANAPPIELAADSEEERQRWMFALGESVCKVQTPPSPVSVTSELMPSDLAELPGGELLGSPSGGRVHLGRAKVADNYTMGKVLAQGEDYMIVEGFNVKTNKLS